MGVTKTPDGATASSDSDIFFRTIVDAPPGGAADGATVVDPLPMLGSDIAWSLSDVLPHIVTVAGPSPAAGEYGASGNTFGPSPPPGGLTAEVVLVDDGSGTTTDACEPIVNDISGKIALVDRGTCFFSTKAANAQAADAVGVIIASHLAGDWVTMAAGSSETITIPVVLVRLPDGDALKAALPMTATLSDRPAGACAISAAGELSCTLGDLAGGFRVIVTTSVPEPVCNQWSTDGTVELASTATADATNRGPGSDPGSFEIMCTPVPIPELGTLVLFATGLLGLAGVFLVRRRSG